MTGIITITESDHIEDIGCVITEREKAVLTVEFEDGHEEQIALDRQEAEALCEMIEDSYSRHDESVSGGKSDT